MNLTALPNGSVKLTLRETGSLEPVAGAKIEVLNTPIVGLSTNALGEVTIAGLPVGPPWTVRVGKFGRALTDTEAQGCLDSLARRYGIDRVGRTAF